MNRLDIQVERLRQGKKKTNEQFGQNIINANRTIMTSTKRLGRLKIQSKFIPGN